MVGSKNTLPTLRYINKIYNKINHLYHLFITYITDRTLILMIRLTPRKSFYREILFHAKVSRSETLA
ncbi:MAG: hypothetical protein DRR16_02605 [Candidatus Parabeggiatoa sp. nov. 3]|nr:MAG: hypothetical protein DRR00_10560 [Gammaproteobacteria bacterium]RKZ65778.1 MAG: hypothetical protein DRQ99_11735 [Gammaproteobacteria bacterium]RKZ89379.1 MAG: hypothetical protein DRR16_02605 [Gammaproteobacteria bacterium]